MEIAISYGIYSILYFNFVHFITAHFIIVIGVTARRFHQCGREKKIQKPNFEVSQRVKVDERKFVLYIFGFVIRIFLCVGDATLIYVTKRNGEACVNNSRLLS